MSAGWTDYDVSANVLIETNGGLAFVMGRVGSVPGFSDALPRGYWLALNNASAQWELHCSSNLLAAGAATIPTNTWHGLRLAMQGSSLKCYVDGALVTNVTDSTYASGMAGLGCGWHGAQFDDFTLRQLHRASLNLAPAATARASSVWQNDPTYAASMANDGDPTTRWNTGYPTLSNEWLELDFPAPVTFNHTTYSQFDDRIFGYQVQHWNGAGWSVDVNGGTMGAFASDIFPAVTSSKVRLLLTNFTSAPSIYEFQVFADPPPVAPVCINEWMSSNSRSLYDPAGGYQPWFELYNAGTSNVNLAGYYLTGSLSNLFRFQVPAGYSLTPGGYLLVWTDGQTSQNTGGASDLHVPFSLRQSQLIALLNPAGQVVDAVDLLPQAADVSSGSNPDGDPAVLNLPAPSPRRSNNQVWALPPVPRWPDGAMLLSFVGLVFAPHRVLASATLAPPAWSTVASVLADGLGSFTWADTNTATRSQRYYRAVCP